MKSRVPCSLYDLRRTRGFTLPEALLAAAVMGLVLLAIVELSPKMFKFFTRIQVRQQANMEARRCTETIEAVMADGRASTLMYSSLAGHPDSQIQFSGFDNTTYSIFWSNSPPNSVHLKKTPPGGGTSIDTVLATHVTTMIFTPPDVRDPSQIPVTMTMAVPLDATGAPGSFYTIYLPTQVIQMTAS